MHVISNFRASQWCGGGNPIFKAYCVEWDEGDLIVLGGEGETCKIMLSL